VSFYPNHPLLLFINDKSAESISGASEYGVDNASEMHAPGHGMPSTSMQTVQLSTHFHSQSSTAPTLNLLFSLLMSLLLDLLDQDSEMQRAMGAAESFDGASTNQEPPRAFPMLSIDNICSIVVTAPVPPTSQMALSSLAARPRSSLVRAGSLTEAKLTANASRRLQRPPTRQESYDSSE
jgi:serine/arginine repetitive matrix protein 2